MGEYDDFTASEDDESEVDKPSASPLALAPTSDTVREQDVAGPERGGFREDASVSDRGQIREESIAPVGFKPKPSYVFEDDPNQVGVSIFESGISALSTQEQ